MLFDSHTHMNVHQFDEDRDERIQKAVDQDQVSYMLNVGFNRETIASTLSLAEQYDFIYAAVGWHPTEAHHCQDEDLDWIRSLTHHPKVVALGEMGLDYHWDHAPRDVQADIFRKQIRMARELELPIVIHNREAVEDIMAILREEQAQEVGGVMHCFSGDVATMYACLEMNFLIGLGGPVTFKNAKLPKEIAKEVPLESLLIETDAPFLAPHPYRGKRNETGYVHLVAEKIAQLRGIRLEELAEQTTKNALRLFKIEETVHHKNIDR